MMKLGSTVSMILAMCTISPLIVSGFVFKGVGRTFVVGKPRVHQGSTSSSFATLTNRKSNSLSRGRVSHSIYSSNILGKDKSTTTSGVIMWFGSWFGMDPKIDYTSLDHPGPELAKFALEGVTPQVSERDPSLTLATFAGGCFWGLELAYQRVPGVVYTAVGYTQGPESEPTYGQVCSGSTGHTEAIMVYYNPSLVSYDQLLDTFFSRVNPTTVNGQGNDFGSQYRTGVYFHSKEQEEIANQRFEKEKSNYSRPIATELKPAKPFWPAEKYHQQYLEKGGRFGQPQSAAKGSTDTIRCYG